MLGWLQTARETWAELSGAWRQRDRNPGSERTREEASFLTRLEEIEETPPVPAAEFTMWAIIALLVAGLLWAYFGKTDVVAVAPGKIIPDERIKIVQAATGGIVREILVSDGDKVAEGQVLFAMESAETRASMEQVREQVKTAQLGAAMHRLLVGMADADGEPVPDLADIRELRDVSPGRLLRQQQVLDGLFEAYASARSEIRKEIEALAEAQRTQGEAIADAEKMQSHKVQLNVQTREGEQIQASKLRQLLASAKEEYEALERLHANEVVSGRQVREAQEKYVSLREDLAYRTSLLEQIELEGEGEQLQLEEQIHRHRDRMQELDAEIDRKRETLRHLEYEFRQRHLLEKEASEQELARLRQELVKLDRALEDLSILAPADGIVQQLALHTEGAVVQPSQQLLVIVPGDRELVVEAVVENKDIGFIYPGQPVQIKVDTFSFTKYGQLDGDILHLSPDAVEIEGKGPVYLARIRMRQTSMVVEGKEIQLSPGMSVVAEISLGKRRVIEFFLSPLLRAGSESLRER